MRLIPEAFHNESHNCECPVPCEITKYQLQLSYAQTPAKHFSEVLARRKHVRKDIMRHYLRYLFQSKGVSCQSTIETEINLSRYSFVRDNFLELDVYFEEMQVTLIHQRQAYDQESLFGKAEYDNLYRLLVLTI